MAIKIDRIVAHLSQCMLGFTYCSGEVPLARAVVWEFYGGGHISLGENQSYQQGTKAGFENDRADAGGFSDNQRALMRGSLKYRMGLIVIQHDAMLAHQRPMFVGKISDVHVSEDKRPSWCVSFIPVRAVKHQ
jgi:hypothetical protein